MIASELKLINLLPVTLDSREAAIRLADIVREYSGDKQIELDFSGIEFMSRSFADQFHKELYLHDEDTFEIVIKNADASIIRMLDAVSKTQTKRKAVKKTHQVASYNDLKQMESFVTSW
ncbi:STAS-like domain-containing protein [Parapedobacter soli]|uniref:STAS-like domain-containing protein n=1 Tax=Parapedobacter soli TaxID=416955 RepID=UPI0021C9C22C|nr:STAS-like domain-containing protein [Parapedobacter soli]